MNSYELKNVLDFENLLQSKKIKKRKIIFVDFLLNKHTSIGFCVFRLHKTTILGTLLKIDRRSLRNVPKNGTTLHVGISNARLTASQY